MATPGNQNADPTTIQPPRARRWVPLSLRMFAAILVILVVSSVLWIGIPAYRQHVAIREIEQVDGSVRTNPVGPAWLRSWVGDERMKLFDRVDDVEFGLRGCQKTGITNALSSA
ncbi:MAG: hypothetical protein HY290_17315 [Planctomycetia bacterium]|nr:hypothetical protein [Planctomycetia bacterium]